MSALGDTMPRMATPSSTPASLADYDPEVGAIRQVIRQSLAVHHDEGKAGYDAAAFASYTGLSDAKLRRAWEDVRAQGDGYPPAHATR